MSDNPYNKLPQVQEHKRQKELEEKAEEQTTKELLEKSLTPEEKKLKKKFSEFLYKNPLLAILNTFEEKHAGSTTERKSIITAFIYTLNSIATGGGELKITGSSSAGKSDAAEAILKCFPDEWIKTIDDPSPASIKYIDWQDEKILYIKEAKDRSTEQLKLMDKGDGGFVAAVTMGSPSEGFRTVEIKIPVKFILTTRAEGLFDQQLENRMFEVSSDETKEQTFNILFIKAIREAGFGYNTSYKFDAIKSFISQLSLFDEIRVPYSFLFIKLLTLGQIRTRRDYDKIMMLCKASAFLNQKNRPTKIKDGKALLYATPEDAYNVLTLSMDSFHEATTGLNKKLRVVYDILPSDGEGLTYLEISKNTPVSKKTVQRYCEELDSLGYIETDNNKKPYRIKRANEKKIVEATFDDHKIPILLYSWIQLGIEVPDYDLQLSWYDFSDVLNWDTYWDIASQKKSIKEKNWDNDWDNGGTKNRIFYEKSELLNLFNDNDKLIIKHPCLGVVSLIVPPSIRRGDKKLYIGDTVETVGQNAQKEAINLIDFCVSSDSVSHSTKNEKPSLDDRISLQEKHQKAKEIIEENPDNNFKLVEEICGIHYIEQCLKWGILEELFCGRTLKWVGGP